MNHKAGGQDHSEGGGGQALHRVLRGPHQHPGEGPRQATGPFPAGKALPGLSPAEKDTGFQRGATGQDQDPEPAGLSGPLHPIRVLLLHSQCPRSRPASGCATDVLVLVPLAGLGKQSTDRTMWGDPCPVPRPPSPPAGVCPALGSPPRQGLLCGAPVTAGRVSVRPLQGAPGAAPPLGDHRRPGPADSPSVTSGTGEQEASARAMRPGCHPSAHALLRARRAGERGTRDSPRPREQPSRGHRV